MSQLVAENNDGNIVFETGSIYREIINMRNVFRDPAFSLVVLKIIENGPSVFFYAWLSSEGKTAIGDIGVFIGSVSTILVPTRYTQTMLSQPTYKFEMKNVALAGILCCILQSFMQALVILYLPRMLGLNWSLSDITTRVLIIALVADIIFSEFRNILIRFEQFLTLNFTALMGFLVQWLNFMLRDNNYQNYIQGLALAFVTRAALSSLFASPYFFKNNSEDSAKLTGTVNIKKILNYLFCHHYYLTLGLLAQELLKLLLYTRRADIYAEDDLNKFLYLPDTLVELIRDCLVKGVGLKHKQQIAASADLTNREGHGNTTALEVARKNASFILPTIFVSTGLVYSMCYIAAQWNHGFVFLADALIHMTRITWDFGDQMLSAIGKNNLATCLNIFILVSAVLPFMTKFVDMNDNKLLFSFVIVAINALASIVNGVCFRWNFKQPSQSGFHQLDDARSKPRMLFFKPLEYLKPSQPSCQRSLHDVTNLPLTRGRRSLTV